MTPTLYILMRTDMASLNPGKAMAQAAHAANLFHATDARVLSDVCMENWWGDRGFGTTIVLGVTGEQLLDVVEGAVMADFAARIVTDPTYPIRDGVVTHVLPLDTCGYVFTPCRQDYPVKALEGLDLHP